MGLGIYALCALGASAWLLLGYGGKPFRWKRALVLWLAQTVLVSLTEPAAHLRASFLLWQEAAIAAILLHPSLVLAGFWGGGFSRARARARLAALGRALRRAAGHGLSHPWLLGTLAVLAGAGLALYPPAMPAGSLIAGLGMAALAILAVAELVSADPSAHKARPDGLTGPAVQAAVRKACAAGDGVWAGELDGAPLRIGTEDRAAVIGPPGTGKTAFLVSQLLDWADSGRPFVVTDVKPEIYGIVRARLEAQGYRLLTYNPTRRTGERYNPLDDLEGPEAMGELAAALIPSPRAEDAVFNESARDLLDALISHVRAERGAVSLPDVRAFAAEFDEHKGLLRRLAKSPSKEARELAHGLAIMAQNERLLGAVFATLRGSLRFLRYPAIRDSLARSDFSLAALCGSRAGLFLQFEERHQETTAPLLSALLGHLMRYLITHADRPPVLLLLDEIGTAPRIAGLARKLNTLRSRRLPTWLYWQSKEQMQAYGEKADEGPSVILGACDLHMVFRLNDNATADWLSRKIGTVDRVVQARSVTHGAGWLPSFTRSEHLVQEPAVFPHELQQLAAGEVIAAYRGLAWRGQATPYFKRWPEYAGRGPDQVVAAAYPDGSAAAAAG